MQRQEGGLRPREREILLSIVRAYIENGEPLGSRTLSKLTELNLSAASIRNVMADLADSGYLYQPHTSAGRIPTDKALRLYVSTIATRPEPGTARCAPYRRLGQRAQRLHPPSKPAFSAPPKFSRR